MNSRCSICYAQTGNVCVKLVVMVSTICPQGEACHEQQATERPQGCELPAFVVAASVRITPIFDGRSGDLRSLPGVGST